LRQAVEIGREALLRAWRRRTGAHADRVQGEPVQPLLIIAGNVPYFITRSYESSLLSEKQIFAASHIGHPIALFGPTIQLNPPKLLLDPSLNASAVCITSRTRIIFEIVDVAHATLRMRFALTQTIQDTATPLAIDSGRRFVYLVTDKGLTVVDCGAAPLSIVPPVAGELLVRS
jgi:hypothetical protein